MDVKVVFDYKVVLALGVVAVGIIFARKLDSAAVKDVSIRAIDTVVKYVAVAKGNCGLA